MKTNLYLGADHAGFTAKGQMMDFILKEYPQFALQDEGTYSLASCHYPEMAMKVVQKMKEDTLRGLDSKGILICGSGIGMSVVANRFQGMNAALCHNVEEAVLSREHNNANILCLGARFLDEGKMQSIVSAWLKTKFLGGRHQERINLFTHLGTP